MSEEETEEKPKEGEEKENEEQELPAKRSVIKPLIKLPSIKFSLTPEAVLMLAIATFLDTISGICAIFVFFFGISLLFAKIVYIVGLIFIGTWAFFRSGAIATKKKTAQGKIGKKMTKELGDFLKKHGGKMVGKAIPLIGDIIPFWTITVWSELNN